ncbi:hypothetical protein GCM10010244_55700 [Streptomyces coeruleorubidus]|nr:hypothetical protein GCM10010244_55700 [Streptomyces bellus]
MDPEMTTVAGIAQDMAARALTWLHANRHRGALGDGGIAGDPDAYKALTETALAACLVLRDGAAGSREAALARNLLDFCWDQLQEGALLYDRLLRHPLLTDALEGYAHFARAGYRHPGVERLIPHLAATGIVTLVEHVPNRRLAVANALRITGHGQALEAAHWETLARATWLGSTPAPWHIDWMTGYHLTHTVFHLTDWGARPDGLPEDVAAHLTRWLPVWIDIWSETCQFDLVGELLLVDSCLLRPHADPADWQCLAQRQHSDGLMPRDGNPVDDDPVIRFKEHQHTTIVAAVAGTVALTRALDRAGDGSGTGLLAPAHGDRPQ